VCVLIQSILLCYYIPPYYFQELFHGPTFAFKDVALQMLGNFFEYFLETGSNGGRLAVLGATSGDTGSAAIAGLRGKKGIDCIILFPNGRVSDIQERQMTTVPDRNIHCVAIDGTFDDCQDLVKASFNTPAFREKVHLGAVNSINWCRVLAQTTYYFWTYLRVTDNHKDITEVHFAVPTGNFGDILAGYYSKLMGLPVGKLIVATNENDILHRFFTKGEYHRESIAETISPSMDICVSSNFERYLFHLAGNDAAKLAEWMNDFESTHTLTITGELLRKAQIDFDSFRADTTETLQTIKLYHEKYNYLLCPHSAVGVAAIHQLSLVCEASVCLVNPLPPPPPELAALATLPTRRTELPNDVAAVQAFVEDCVFGNSKLKRWLGLEKVSNKSLVTVATVVGLVAIAVQLVSRRR
jgi:threonine synthase